MRISSIKNSSSGISFVAHRTCTLEEQENRDFLSLMANQINISCECHEPGYEWSSRFGLCVDVNECSRGEHSCSSGDGETCINMPGGYECICRFGYVYDQEQRACALNSAVEAMLAEAEAASNETETFSVIEMIVRTVTRSAGNCRSVNYATFIPIITII